MAGTKEDFTREMGIGCFAFALALVASAFAVSMVPPPYQTQRLCTF